MHATLCSFTKTACEHNYLKYALCIIFRQIHKAVRNISIVIKCQKDDQ